MTLDPRRVHPTVVFENFLDCDIDPTATIGAFCILRGPLVIGAQSVIHPHVVIGTDAEHRFHPSIGVVRIGVRVEIREFSIVHRGTGDRDTTIGDRSLLMKSTHVAHDCVLGEDVTLSPHVVLGGHTRVHRGATIGIGAMTHQRTTIGALSMIGQGSVVVKDVPVGACVVGNPARYLRENTAAAHHGRFDNDLVHEWPIGYRLAFDADRRPGRGVIERFER